jgi:hypothetical protein
MNRKLSTAARQEPNFSTKSWRDVLPVHPAAELFPLMSSAELKELAEDIKKHGLLEPVVFWKPPAGTGNKPNPLYLLDGRNRLDALAMAGLLEVDNDGWPCLNNQFTIVRHCDSDPYALVISLNIRRRHLTPEQREDLRIKFIARDPEKSDRQIGRELGIDHKTVANARAKGEDAGRIPRVAARTDTKGRRQPAAKTKRTKVQPIIDVPPQPREAPPGAQPPMKVSPYTLLIDAWLKCSPDEQHKFRRFIGCSAVDRFELLGSAKDNGMQAPSVGVVPRSTN